MRTAFEDLRTVAVSAASAIPRTCLKCPVWLRTGRYTCTDLDLPLRNRCEECIHRNHFPDLHEGEGRCPIVVARTSAPAMTTAPPLVLLCVDPATRPRPGRCREPPCLSDVDPFA